MSLLSPASSRALAASCSKPTLAVAPTLPQPCRSFSSTSSRDARPRAVVARGFDIEEMQEFKFDDLPTSGHLALNRQRMLLSYHRRVVHELPELEKFRQQYKPPPAENILRFRTVHFQGTPHPVGRKSVVTVSVPALLASPAFTAISDPVRRARAQRKLLHLAGPRWDPGQGVLPEVMSLEGKYDPASAAASEGQADGASAPLRVPDVGEIKISCQLFPEQAQNMKWCSDTLDAMIHEATTQPDDGIAALPIDVRHALIRSEKKVGAGRNRKAGLRDWPAEWPTPKGSKA